jgi:hypothetical protein
MARLYFWVALSTRSGTARRRARQAACLQASTRCLHLDPFDKVKPNTARFPIDCPHPSASSSSIGKPLTALILLPSRVPGAHAEALKQESDRLLPLLDAVTAAVSVLPDALVKMVLDYAWHHPPMWSKFPIRRADAGWLAQRFYASNMLYGADKVENFVSEEDIGRIGFEFHSSSEWSPLFAVVWVHPCNDIFGVVYFNIPRLRWMTSRRIIEITDAHYPISLMTTRQRSGGGSRQGSVYLYPQSKNTLSPDSARFKLVNKFDEGGGFDIGSGGARPSCHVSPLMYPALDNAWWQGQDLTAASSLDLRVTVIHSPSLCLRH